MKVPWPTRRLRAHPPSVLIVEVHRTFGNLGVVLAAFVVAGCGGGGGGPSIPIDQFLPQYVAATCHTIFACCDATEIAALGSIDPTIVDEASCEASLTAMAAMHWANDKALVDAGFATYHGDRARACLDAVSSLTCSTWGGPFGTDRPPQCDGLLVGTLPAGSACALGGQCASGYCVGTGDGEPACAAPVELGESCQFAPCVSGLACVSDSSGSIPRTCGYALPDGSPCFYDPDCKSGLCAEDAATGQYACSRAARTCDGI